MIRLGTSGWKYKDWIGTFYPSRQHHFHYYKTIFDTAEINSTFYTYPVVKVVEALVRNASKDFVFTERDFLPEWQRRFPDAQVRVVPDAGHYVVEDAHERIVPWMLEFLRE